MSTARRWKLVPLAIVAAAAFVPLAGADGLTRPLISQDVTPLVRTVVDAARYIVPPALNPIRTTVKGLLPPTSLLLRGTVVTMDDAHTVIPDGNVLVSQGRIRAVWSGSTPPASVDTGGATVVDARPDGLIYPGMINLHDHPTYDVLHLWPPPASDAQPDVGRLFGTEPYANRYQWGPGRLGPVEKMRLVNNPHDILVSDDALGLYAEVLKHAEARAILGGQTAIQGESDEPAADGVLVRSVNGTNWGRDGVEARVPSVDNPDFPTEAAALKAGMDSGSVDAWLVHLAEGVRDADRPAGDNVSSRRELATIRDHGVLTDAAVVIHGVGLEREDFAEMRGAPVAGEGDGLGAKLVWSPLSNLLLYGRTAEVYDALAEDVTVSLGTDWTPSGSHTLLGELKIADIALRDARILGDRRAEVPSLADDAMLDRALVDMVTRAPARTLRWDGAGTIAPGKVADILVLHRPSSTPTGGMPDSPYRSLIDATERDVGLVLVEGEPLSGDVDVMRALRGSDLEVIGSRTGGYAKAIDVTRPGVPMGRQTLAEVEGRLTEALRALGGDGAVQGSGPVPPSATFSFLRKHFDGGRYLLSGDDAFRNQVLAPRYPHPEGGINLERLELKPLLTDDDDFFFAVVGATSVAGVATPDDSTPPFRPYSFNTNVAVEGENPFAPARLFDRFYAPSG